jgi:hypothetical protein
MKVATYVVLFVTVTCNQVLGDGEQLAVKYYSSEEEWIRNQSETDLFGKRISFGLFTNRFCSLTDLLQLGREVQTDEFRELTTFAKRTNEREERDPQYKVFVAKPNHHINLTFLVSTNGLSTDSFRAFDRRVRHYVHLRKEGMSAAYSQASLREYKEQIDELKPNWGEKPQELTRDETKRRFWIPDKWIADSYSSGPTVFVMDTNYVWKFHAVFPPKRFDAKEFDARLGPIIAAAQVEAMKDAARSDTYAEMWKAAQRNLRLRYQIDWASPAELNADPMFDLVLTNRWWLTNR